MTYTSIMVGLDLGAGSRERTRLAAQLAERFQARLIGVASRQPDYPRGHGADNPRGYGQISVLGGSAMEEIRKAALADVAETEKAFRAAAGMARRIEWRCGLEDPEVFLEEQSRAADLVVIGRLGGEDLSDPRMSVNAGVALMALGRPVLVVPPGVDHLSLKRIVVAWKNTLQTRRAISDAMPLLKLAEQVQVVRIAVPEDHEDVEDVVKFLGLHGVNAIPFRQSPDGASVAVSLQEAAKAVGAGLIVSGAYGHNRVREWFFGGVTRALLDHCPICCLMSH